MKRFIFTLILLTTFTANLTLTCLSQTTQNIDFSSLEKTVSEELREKNAAGAAVAMIRGDKVIFAKGFGAANTETGTPVTSDTIFQIGSVTKTFTATMILSMAAEGKLKLDLPIGNYAKGLSPKILKVTLQQLLSHTGGILDEPDEFGAQDESMMAPYIRSWKDDYCLFDGGEVFSYSNSGYALAGFTAQETGGKLYADLMSERLFGPLGMKSTTFRPTVAMTYPLAVGHRTKAGEKAAVVRPLPNDARLYPAGTMYSNLNDMARFAIAFLNAGKLEGKQVISPAVIEQMSTPHARQLSAPDEVNYGYGMFIKNYRSVRQLWHEGGMTGYTASMLFVPERHFAVIILSNSDNVVFDKTQEKALELALKLAPKETPPEKRAQPMTAAEMAAYTGTYTQPNRFNVEIFLKKGKLFIREFNQEMLLSKTGENRFIFQSPGGSRTEEIYIQPSTPGKPGFVHQYVLAFKKIK